MNVNGAIAEVIRAASRKHADAALREYFRDRRLPPEDQRKISRGVFGFFRWAGWVDMDAPLKEQIVEADELRHRYANDPKSFEDADLLAHAVPEWALAAAPISAPMIREWQREPRLWLRARPGEGRAIAKAFGDSEVHPKVPDAVSYNGPLDLYRTKEFHEGKFEIQDLSSQLVGHLCAPAPGQTWWDACAGEGGKTLHLCDQMQNKGLVWASDPAQWRLDILKKRCGRAKLFNYRIKKWEPSGVLPTKTKFDGVLVDAPCSGIGTWGKNPHARWSTKPEDVTELGALQKEILGKVAASVKPGGKLIYSVCTIANAETTEVAAWFNETFPQFRPLKTASPLKNGGKKSEYLFLPQELQANAMYVALWERIAN